VAAKNTPQEEAAMTIQMRIFLAVQPKESKD